MRSFENANYQDLVRVNPFELSNGELKAFVAELSRQRELQLKNVTPSVSAMNERIERAQHELSSRASSRLATVSIIVASLAMIVSATGIVIQL